LRLEFFDADIKSNEYLGEAVAVVEDLVRNHSATGKWVAPLLDKQGRPQGKSSVSIRFELLADVQDVAKIQISGKALEKMDFFGKSDPFLQISRKRGDDTWAIIHTTEHVLKTLDPVWKPFEVPLTLLANADWDRPIKFKCFDWNASGKADFIGEFTTSIREIVAKTPKSFQLLRPGEAQAKPRGTITFDRFEFGVSSQPDLGATFNPAHNPESPADIQRQATQSQLDRKSTGL
jgi:hypothetical protein